MKPSACDEAREVERWRVRGALLAVLVCGVLAACDASDPISEQERRVSEATALALPEPLTLPPLSEEEVRERPKGAGTPTFYLRVETDAPRRLRFRCDTVTLVGCALGLFDANGTRLSFGSSEPRVMRTDFYARLPAPGTYYLGVSGAEGSFGTFRYQLINLGVDPTADTAEEATPIEPAQLIEEPLQGAGDVDAYTFEVKAERLYSVRCTAPKSDRKWSFRFFMPGMSEPEVHGGYSPMATSFHRAPQDGMGSFIVETPIGNAPADAPIPFSCKLEVIIDDAPDVLSGPARPLPIGTEVRGTLEWYGDTDIFAVTLPVRHHLTAMLHCLGHCYMEVYLPSGPRLLGWYTSLGELQWTSREAGEHRVKVYGSGTDLPYTLRFTDLGPDDAGDTLAEATTVTIETPLTGRIGAAWDTDIFIVEAPAGQTLDLSCGTLGAGLRGQMYLSDLDGRLLVSHFLEPTPIQDSLTVPASGRFEARFRDLLGLPGYRCEWTVRTGP